jgi:hypothetical protein
MTIVAETTVDLILAIARAPLSQTKLRRKYRLLYP